MRPGVLTKWIVLTAALVLSGLGCAHTPAQPERKVYVIFDDIRQVRFKSASFLRGTGGAGADAYCNEVQKRCYADCWNSRPELTSIKPRSENHYKYCTTKCLEEFQKCVKELNQQEEEEKATRKELDPSNFSTIEGAIAWFRRHAPEEPPLGTIVTVGGVELTLAELAGALVLAP